MALKVLGLGFGRTATLSLKHALEKLGFGPCYHMVEILDNPKRAREWAKLANGEKVDWETIYDGYSSACDWPTILYWRELVEHYPEAKVVLTVRSPESWFESMCKTIFARGRAAAEALAALPEAERAAAEKSDMNVMFASTRRPFPNAAADRDHAIAVFNEHNAAVKRAIPPERLLVLEPGQGWEPLCRFLGVPVPSAPYPKTNAPDEFWTTSPSPGANT